MPLTPALSWPRPDTATVTVSQTPISRLYAGNRRRRESSAFAEALHSLLGDLVCCVPGFVLDAPDPTTVGLGDTFVGGFLTSVALTRRSDQP